MKNDNIQSFTAIGTPTVLAERVIRYLQNWKNRADFPVDPGDDIYHVYGIVDEDLDDFILAIAETNGFKLPESTAYWQNPIVTVEDAIRFILTFPPKSS